MIEIEMWDCSYLDRPIRVLQPETGNYFEWYPEWFEKYKCIKEQLYAQMMGWA